MISFYLAHYIRNSSWIIEILRKMITHGADDGFAGYLFIGLIWYFFLITGFAFIISTIVVAIKKEER